MRDLLIKAGLGFAAAAYARYDGNYETTASGFVLWREN